MSTDDEVDGIAGDLDFEEARRIDEKMDDEQAQSLATRKLLYRIGSDVREDIGIVEAAYRTIAVIDDHERRLTRLEDKFDRVDRAAETALTIAETEAQPGDSVSKKSVAKLKSRNEAVVRLARGGVSNRASVTAPDVQDMCKPEVVVHYQTVKDAWNDLESDWEAFDLGTNEDDQRVLRVDRPALEPQLVKAVERNVDRDDLAKRLISDTPTEVS